MGLRSLLSRFRSLAFGGARNTWEEYGYPQEIGFQDYYVRYRREHIAKRIVAAPASATWRHFPKITDDEDPLSDTPFEEAWKKLASRLRVFHYMERVDRISGIGRYGVLLIGVEGQPRLELPVDTAALRKDTDAVLFLGAFHEGAAEVEEWEDDTSSPRFNRPRTYKLNLGEDGSGRDRKTKVHWSRVIHVAEGLESDEVYGEPRLEVVFNLFEDLSKVVGASAELFWQAAFLGLQLDLKEGAELSPDEEKRIEKEMEEWLHKIRRYIRTQNIEVKNLGGIPADPRGVFEVLLTLISGATGIPKRVLTGSERGELASTQDETNWNARIEERRSKHAEPDLVRPFIDRLLDWGVLPEPKEGYEIVWPSLFELDDKEKADVALKKAQALKAVTDSPAEDRIDMEFFIEEVLEWKASDLLDDVLDEEDPEVRSQFGRVASG